MLTDDQTSAAAEIEQVLIILESMRLTPDETHALLAYLTGHSPRAMRDAIRYTRDVRKIMEQRRAWKACPATGLWPTHMQHTRSCRTCNKEN